MADSSHLLDKILTLDIKKYFFFSFNRIFRTFADEDLNY